MLPPLPPLLLLLLLAVAADGTRPYSYAEASCYVSRWAERRIADLLALDAPPPPGTAIDDRELVAPYARSIAAFKSDVGRYADRYARTLIDVLDEHADVSYYADTNVLETLVSLRANAHRAPPVPPDHRVGTAADRDVLAAIRSLLSDMAAFRRFSLRNGCPAANPDAAATRFASAGRVDDDERPRCGAPQTLLERFVSADGGEISRDVLNARVAAADAVTTVRDVLERAAAGRDVRTAAWSHDLVIAAVLRIARAKLASVSPDDAIAPTISGRVVSTSGAIASAASRMPPRLVDGLAVLSELATKKTDVERVPNGRYPDDVVQLEPQNVATTAANDAAEYLEKLFRAVSDSANDFECVRHYSKCLYDERRRYHVPFVAAEDRPKPVSWADDDQQLGSRDLCDFLVNVYRACYRCLSFSRLCGGGGGGDVENFVNCDRTWTAAYAVKNAFLVVVMDDTDDPRLRRVSYDVAMVLANVRGRPSGKNVTENDKNVAELQTALEAVMNVLYGAELKHCGDRADEDPRLLLLYHNVKFMNAAADPARESAAIATYFAKSVKNFAPVHLDTIDVRLDFGNCMNVSYLYSRCIANSSGLVARYENRMRVYWDGAARTAKSVFQNCSATCNLNPRNVYALYDVYFKLTVAAVHYEIGKALDAYGNRPELLREILDDVPAVLTDFTSENLPKELKRFVADVEAVYRRPEPSPPPPPTTTIDERRKIVDEHLRSFNIVFSTDSTVGLSKLFRCSVTKQLLDSLYFINEEHKNQVPYIAYYFKMIEKHRNIDNR